MDKYNQEYQYKDKSGNGNFCLSKDYCIFNMEFFLNIGSERVMKFMEYGQGIVKNNQYVDFLEELF